LDGQANFDLLLEEIKRFSSAGVSEFTWPVARAWAAGEKSLRRLCSAAGLDIRPSEFRGKREDELVWFEVIWQNHARFRDFFSGNPSPPR
jgi:hypothetical protein